MPVKVKNVLLHILVLALAGAGISGCSGSKEQGQANEKQLVIGSQFDVGGSIDPRQGVGGPNLAPKLLIFEPPVYFDENYNLQPLLLTSWKPSKDAKTWTLHLRKGVKFTDGTPLNAEALFFSIRYMTSPGSGLANIQSMDSVDEYTVRLSLKKPDAIFIHTISSLGLMSPTCVDKKGRFVKPVGTGPFQFVEYI
jgi:peptide/nickel transport system substrate-binding protein